MSKFEGPFSITAPPVPSGFFLILSWIHSWFFPGEDLFLFFFFFFFFFSSPGEIHQGLAQAHVFHLLVQGHISWIVKQQLLMLSFVCGTEQGVVDKE